MNSSSVNTSDTKEIDAIISKLTDWRGDKLSQIRSLIKQADPEVVEEVKWKKATNPDGVPVWSHKGIICTGEFYKNHLRFTFAKGAQIEDPKGLFCAYRAIIINKEDTINEPAFLKIVKAAVELNSNNKK